MPYKDLEARRAAGRRAQAAYRERTAAAGAARDAELETLRAEVATLRAELGELRGRPDPDTWVYWIVLLVECQTPETIRKRAATLRQTVNAKGYTGNNAAYRTALETLDDLISKVEGRLLSLAIADNNSDFDW